MGGVEVGVRGPNTWPTIPQHDAHGGGSRDSFKIRNLWFFNFSYHCFLKRRKDGG